MGIFKNELRPKALIVLNIHPEYTHVLITAQMNGKLYVHRGRILSLQGPRWRHCTRSFLAGSLQKC